MTPAKPWHEDDSFGEITMDWIFGQSRLKAAPGEVDNILAMLDIPAPSSILDLCCGPGRHSLELARIFLPRDWIEKDNTFFLEERKPSDDWNFMENRWILIENEKRVEYKFKLRLYSANELSVLLQDAGFGEISIYGGLNGAPYDQKAKRLVIMAQK